MPRPKSVPAYCLHKPSGRARVIIDGKQIYLGVFGSPESREAYARLITERFLPGRAEKPDASAALTTPPPAGIDLNLSINELALRYVEFAETYYVVRREEGCGVLRVKVPPGK